MLGHRTHYVSAGRMVVRRPCRHAVVSMLIPKSAPLSPSSSIRVSVVVLTWNEEANIEGCLRSLARQSCLEFEVVVVDAASQDATATIVARLIPTFPVPIRLHVAATRLPVGPARNLGVKLAKSGLIAFLSADAEADPSWIEQSLSTCTRSELTFGRQVHAPVTVGVGAAVRGLRYHFPDTATDDPKRFASNVNALVRRDVLERFPFGASIGESAVDDLLLAQRATDAGYRIQYDPDMVVRHRDVSSARAEFVKNLREGIGWGEHASELGFHRTILAWGALLLVGIVAVSLAPGILTAYLLAAVLWAPALRRAIRGQTVLAWPDRFVGVVVSPLFDLAFLAAYLRGLLSRNRPRTLKQSKQNRPKEIPT